jgi:hypothetical protein
MKKDKLKSKIINPTESKKYVWVCVSLCKSIRLLQKKQILKIFQVDAILSAKIVLFQRNKYRIW